VIRASPLTRSAYTKVRDSIKGKGEVDWSVDLIALTLRELVAIFFVAQDAMSPVSLRIYFSVSASGVDRARTLPEASFRKATIDSAQIRALSPDPGVESEEERSTRTTSPQSGKTKSKSASNARPAPDSEPVAPRQPTAEPAEVH
jgi:hypothetical protein